jgi:hypothetical protein
MAAFSVYEANNGILATISDDGALGHGWLCTYLTVAMFIFANRLKKRNYNFGNTIGV